MKKSERLEKIRMEFNNKPFLYRMKIHYKVWFGHTMCNIMWFLKYISNG